MSSPSPLLYRKPYAPPRRKATTSLSARYTSTNATTTHNSTRPGLPCPTTLSKFSARLTTSTSSGFQGSRTTTSLPTIFKSWPTSHSSPGKIRSLLGTRPRALQGREAIIPSNSLFNRISQRASVEWFNARQDRGFNHASNAYLAETTCEFASQGTKCALDEALSFSCYSG